MTSKSPSYTQHQQQQDGHVSCSSPLPPSLPLPPTLSLSLSLSLSVSLSLSLSHSLFLSLPLTLSPVCLSTELMKWDEEQTPWGAEGQTSLLPPVMAVATQPALPQMALIDEAVSDRQPTSRLISRLGFFFFLFFFAILSIKRPPPPSPPYFFPPCSSPIAINASCHLGQPFF
ncbi:hypothetical protein TcWFU_003640 [Taenia crassiceps]|uniref:Uncharacterized protein n=1 Tax=Taenia crassiceps TaxID=6207 RepID=A0ABR4QQG5_9CEST